MEKIISEITLRYNEADYAVGARLEEYADDCAAAIKALGGDPEDFYSFEVGPGYTVFRSRHDKVD